MWLLTNYTLKRKITSLISSENKLKLLHTEISDLREYQGRFHFITSENKDENIENVIKERDHYKHEAIKLDRLYNGHTLTVRKLKLEVSNISNERDLYKRKWKELQVENNLIKLQLSKFSKVHPNSQVANQKMKLNKLRILSKKTQLETIKAEIIDDIGKLFLYNVIVENLPI